MHDMNIHIGTLYENYLMSRTTDVLISKIEGHYHFIYIYIKNKVKYIQGGLCMCYKVNTLTNGSGHVKNLGFYNRDGV